MLLTRLETGATGIRGLRAGGAILLLAVWMGACEAPVAVRGPEPYDPLPSYQLWWVELEECVGLKRDFDRIRWYLGETIVVEDREAYGVWVAPDLIIMQRFYATSETAVKHEMLHHLSRGSLSHDHPAFARCTVARSPDSAATWTVDPVSGGR